MFETHDNYIWFKIFIEFYSKPQHRSCKIQVSSQDQIANGNISCWTGLIINIDVPTIGFIYKIFAEF